ncbi:sulfite exporter TauE/SafE family protein [Ochrobactrum sp. XJ1]|nr:sulfite exporter TauE/SafE family protein [Ochrobactrum sp. XJ1]
MNSISLIRALGSGGLVGFMLGLVGGGGSILATPLLLYVVGVSSPHVAIGTSAFAVAINAYANLFSHSRKGNVLWRQAAWFAAFGTLGALLGSRLGLLVDGKRLLLLFSFFMFIVGLFMLSKRSTHGNALRGMDGHTIFRTAATAMGTGIAAGFFGIGGGFLVVPALIFATGMPTINAIASSLLSVGTFGLATGLNYAIAGMVDWRLTFAFIVGGTICGYVGMTLSSRLSTHKNALNRILAVLILAVAAYVMLQNLP